MNNFDGLSWLAIESWYVAVDREADNKEEGATLYLYFFLHGSWICNKFIVCLCSSLSSHIHQLCDLSSTVEGTESLSGKYCNTAWRKGMSQSLSWMPQAEECKQFAIQIFSSAGITCGVYVAVTIILLKATDNYPAKDMALGNLHSILDGYCGCFKFTGLEPLEAAELTV